MVLAQDEKSLDNRNAGVQKDAEYVMDYTCDQLRNLNENINNNFIYN